MAAEGSAIAQTSGNWSAGLTRKHWRVLTGSYLGWLFDGYETFALVIALPFAMASLLTPEQSASAPFYAGFAIGMTLLGWGLGGLAGGVLADYFGRKRMMMIAVLLYALLSGLTAFSTSFMMLIMLRFLTGIALGSEWSTGIALVAESWPDKARPKGLGFLQSAFGMGAFIAAGAWFVLGLFDPLGDESWRIMFIVGAIPALFVLYLRRALEESERWLAAIREKRWSAIEGERGSASSKRPFTLTSVFSSAEGRRRVYLTLILSFTTTTGWWAGSTLLPGYTELLAAAQGEPAGVWGPRMNLIYTAGGVLAYALSGFVADCIGRRKFLFLTFAGSLVSAIVTFAMSWPMLPFMAIAFVNGVFTLGFAYSWMAIYPVELFTASVRSSAASAIFNGARLIAWVFPIIAGTLVANFGGPGNAALIISMVYILGLIVPWFLPETRGKPLPQ
jgi:MFS family permease